jgi:hypothetical protein
MGGHVVTRTCMQDSVLDLIWHPVVGGSRADMWKIDPRPDLTTLHGRVAWWHVVMRTCTSTGEV